MAGGSVKDQRRRGVATCNWSTGPGRLPVKKVADAWLRWVIELKSPTESEREALTKLAKESPEAFMFQFR
jgi:hypothetical protein